MKTSYLSFIFLLTLIASCSAPIENEQETSQNTGILTSDPVIMAYYVAERDYQPEKFLLKS
ncbi:hypothetical protein V8V91_09645 [Algoriphagus halophilus]|uniref:hypothetical protein n=1 Tax=Algoriphagus halophilus TaxID=226505 RepID=UPI00358FE1BA